MPKFYRNFTFNVLICAISKTGAMDIFVFSYHALFLHCRPYQRCNTTSTGQLSAILTYVSKCVRSGIH